MITALCGGVGGSKLVLGLYRTVPQDSLQVVVNTADDTTFYGLHVSPDLDTVMYTLAGLAPPERGWGIDGDTLNAVEMLKRYGEGVWFHVGDRDLATHLLRTDGLRRGRRLSEITSGLAGALGVRARILPMTNDRVVTRLRTDGEWLEFQEYFVHRRYRDVVAEVRFEGVSSAQPAPTVLDALSDAELVVIVNSNPVVSIFPILAVPGVQARVAAHPRVVAVSPIVGRDAVSGPAGRLLESLGYQATASGVAAAYGDAINGIVIDASDAEQAEGIEQTGVRVLVTDTIMRSPGDRERLAREVVAFGREEL